MTRASRVLRAIFISLTLVALLCPLAGNAQQTTSSAEDAITKLNTSAPGAGLLSQGCKLPSENPFERPGSGNHKKADDADSPDSLQLQMDRKWANASTGYAFTADPSFYTFSHNGAATGEWDSLISSGITAYLSQSGATSLRMTTDLEMYGQRRDTGTAGEPGGRTLTMEWEVARLVPSKLGVLEVAAGRYQQQLLSYGALPNAPLTDPFAGYSVSAAGFETSVTLPDKNITFSVRYGTQHLPAALDRSHTATFELSWTW